MNSTGIRAGQKIPVEYIPVEYIPLEYSIPVEYIPLEFFHWNLVFPLFLKYTKEQARARGRGPRVKMKRSKSALRASKENVG